jgi:rhodanese-related sulfurtransferase
MNVQGYDFEEQIETLDPHTPVYVYCRSGARSAHAQRVLLEKGFDEVYNLKGGILAWNAVEGIG